jgi:hypothetical protein
VQFSSILVGFSGWREGGVDGMVVEHVTGRRLHKTSKALVLLVGWRL